MKRRNQMKKNIAVLCLALVIALGTLGVGYAGWTANLTMQQEVYSGTWEAEFTDDPAPSCSLSEDWATCEVTGHPGYALTVDTGNVSECLSGNITFTITNDGTIPLKVTKVEFLTLTSSGKYSGSINGDGDLQDPILTFGPDERIELPECQTRYFDLDNDDKAELSFHLLDDTLPDDPKLIGVQFDPPDGDPDHVDGKIYFHVEAGTPDHCDDLDFDIGFEAVPWNQT
jgi:hypothetical protein